jgi:hypothetical protein
MAAVGRPFWYWADIIDMLTISVFGSDSERRWRMQAEPREDKVCVWMTKEEAQNLLREIDKWPELPKVERDLVNALKELPRRS